ncbi:hypothetical protein WA026_011915 [Henosepilachna vigintioctopunctata]|uniref:Uncharacterized protein n=1 Tax=Henosepilachna vigintioctopunctata TaxID=420089 RepID=A0AAW1UMN3_9CUCU
MLIRPLSFLIIRDTYILQDNISCFVRIIWFSKMILGQVICLLLISIVTSQDYTLENTQNSENPYEATINIESQNEQVSTSSTNPQNLENEISSEMKLEGQAGSSVNGPEETKERRPSEMQSDADQFLSSIQNSDELKNALSDELKSLKERETPRIETEKIFHNRKTPWKTQRCKQS